MCFQLICRAIFPEVKLFCSIKNRHYIPPKVINFAETKANETIAGAAKAEDYGIDYERIFHEFVWRAA
tara:strand:- start:2624 stop:2827 length:204 start_codon:yes stop_codon:yes gene_type:complete